MGFGIVIEEQTRVDLICFVNDDKGEFQMNRMLIQCVRIISGKTATSPVVPTLFDPPVGDLALISKEVF